MMVKIRQGSLYMRENMMVKIGQGSLYMRENMMVKIRQGSLYLREIVFSFNKLHDLGCKCLRCFIRGTHDLGTVNV
jgi:hypothetical protein